MYVKQNLMNKAILLTLMVASCVVAQPVILQGPVVDAITYSSARVSWVTDVNSDSVIRYGDVETTNTELVKLHSWFMSGLASATTYQFRVCSKVRGGQEACKEGTVTTSAAQGNTPRLPDPPRQYVDTSMPSGDYGQPFLVDDQCSNLPEILQQVAQLEGDLNHEVRIAPRTTCAGLWTFPNRPNHRGWIVVTTTGSLPQEGTRVGSDHTAEMPRIITNGLPGSMQSVGTFETTCTPGRVIWGGNVPGMGLFGCVQRASTGIKSITQFAAGDNVSVTVPEHGYSTGDLVFLTGTKTGADGTWRITVIDGNNFSFDGARATRPYSGQGTVKRNDVWTQVPYRSGTEFPSECNSNDYFLRTDTQPINGLYWCTSQNTWTNVRPGNYVTASSIAAIQIADHASRYRFVGIEVTHIPVPNPPPAEWATGGGGFGALVVTKSTNDRIIFDRCDVHGLDYPGRLGHGFYLNGSNVAIIDSRVHKINRWTDKVGTGLESVAVDVFDGPGPGKLHNNYLEAIGITVFFPDISRHSLPPADYVITRNYFAHPDDYLPGSPKNWSGKNYQNRQVFELKAGQRMVLEGNIFDGNWADVTQGALVLLTPRFGTEIGSRTIVSIQDGILAVPKTATANPYTPGLLVSVQGTGTGLDGIWEIAEVLNPTTFRLANMPAGSASTGTVVAVTNHMQISDIDIRNNIFRNGPNLLWITGHDGGRTTRTTQRIRLHNNLVVGMDVRSAKDGGRVSPIGDNREGRSGIGVFTAAGMEDLIITNNTIFNLKGNVPAFLYMDLGRNAHAGLLVMDNIFTADKGLPATHNGNSGKAALDLQWKQYPQPSWTFRNNILCCDIRVKSPADNLWPESIEEIGFLNPLLGSLQLSSSTRFAAAGTTGGTIGVNFTALEEAIGQAFDTLLPLIGNDTGINQATQARQAAQPVGVRSRVVRRFR